MSGTEPALWHHRGRDLSEGTHASRGLARRLTGHDGEKRSTGGADETTQTR